MPAKNKKSDDLNLMSKKLLVEIVQDYQEFVTQMEDTLNDNSMLSHTKVLKLSDIVESFLMGEKRRLRKATQKVKKTKR